MSIPLAPPAGMRDLLPPEATARAQLASRLIRLFETWGYELVTTPPFEHAEVIERGLDTLDRRDLLRFVEPDTGEVALLRPDVTPQIARIVATQLRDRPPPWRLCHAGSVIRQRRGRARRQRQIAQAGVECIGLDGIEADVEVVTLAARAIEELGLTYYRIELSLVPLARAALAAIPEEARAEAEEALGRKDGAELGRVLARAKVGREARRRLLGAAELYGDRGVLRDAKAVFRSAEDRRALRDLEITVSRLEDRGLGDRLVLDLGEIRGASYYTGPSFTLLANGPGEPVGSGGRYDGLLERFGVSAPATGFGIDLSNLEWALSAAGHRPEVDRLVRFAVCGGRAPDREGVATALRSCGLGAAVIAARGVRPALDYARGWGYDGAVICKPGVSKSGISNATVVRARDGAERRFERRTIDALGAWAREDGSNR